MPSQSSRRRCRCSYGSSSWCRSRYRCRDEFKSANVHGAAGLSRLTALIATSAPPIATLSESLPRRIALMIPTGIPISSQTNTPPTASPADARWIEGGRLGPLLDRDSRTATTERSGNTSEKIHS